MLYSSSLGGGVDTRSASRAKEASYPGRGEIDRDNHVMTRYRPGAVPDLHQWSARRLPTRMRGTISSAGDASKVISDTSATSPLLIPDKPRLRPGSKLNRV